MDQQLLQDRVTGFVRDLTLFQSPNPFDFVDFFGHPVHVVPLPLRVEVLLNVAVRECGVEVVRDPVFVSASLAHHDDHPLSVGLPRHNDTVLGLADFASVLQGEFGIDESGDLVRFLASFVANDGSCRRGSIW